MQTGWLFASSLAVSCIFATQGCAVPTDRSCFTARPTVVTPQRQISLANLTNGTSGRAVVEAILAGDIATVRTLLAADKALITTEVGYDARNGGSRPVGQYGDLLSFAVSTCNVDMVAALLEAGVPPDGQQIGAALTLALLADTPAIAELLLRSGASPDPQKRGGQNAVYEVTAYGHLGAIMTLIRHKVDTAWVGAFGDGYLQDAVDMEQYRIAELLVEAGANLWQVSGSGAMPVQNLVGSAILESPENEAARLRLQVVAQRTGLSWPPPKPTEVRAMVLSGQWPTAEMAKQGITVPAVSLADMRERFAKPR